MRRLILLFCALLASAAALSQSLTNAQLSSLRAGACADTGTARPLMLAGDANALGAWLNGASGFYVWRTDVSRDDVTGDGFDWTQVDNLTVGQARIWELLFQTQTGRISFASAGKRAAITETWKGTAAKVAVATYIFSQAQRQATQAERILATGTGTQGSPGVATFEGQLSPPVVTGLVFKDNGTLWGC